MGAVTPLSQNNPDNGLDTTAVDSGVSKRYGLKGKPLVGAYIALALFMVIYYGRPEDWIPGLSNVPLAKIAGLLASFALVISLRHVRNRFPREVIYLFLLIGQLFLASIFSPVWRGGATMMTLDFAKVLLVVLVIIAAVNTLRRLRLLILVQTASVALIAAVTIMKGRVLGGRLEGMLGGNYSNSNDLALAMVISLPLCIVLLFLTKNSFLKIAWAVAMLAMVYVVFLTGSRAGFIALVFAATVCLWHFAIHGRRRYFLVLVPVVGLILWLTSGDMLNKRLNETFGSKDPGTEAYASSQQRQLLFWRSIEVTKQYPLFGVGPGNFEQVSGVWHVTHNAFTQLSSEGGLPALILYLLILWHGFLNIRKTRKSAPKRTELKLLTGALHASLIGYIVGSVFASVGFQFFPYILVAYTAALLSITKTTALQSKRLGVLSQSKFASGECARAADQSFSWNPSIF